MVRRYFVARLMWFKATKHLLRNCLNLFDPTAWLEHLALQYTQYISLSLSNLTGRGGGNINKKWIYWS